MKKKIGDALNKIIEEFQKNNKGGRPVIKIKLKGGGIFVGHYNSHDSEKIILLVHGHDYHVIVKYISEEKDAIVCLDKQGLIDTYFEMRNLRKIFVEKHQELLKELDVEYKEKEIVVRDLEKDEMADLVLRIFNFISFKQDLAAALRNYLVN